MVTQERRVDHEDELMIVELQEDVLCCTLKNGGEFFLKIYLKFDLIRYAGDLTKRESKTHIYVYVCMYVCTWILTRVRAKRLFFVPSQGYAISGRHVLATIRSEADGVRFQ